MNEEIMNVDLELRTLSENIKSGTIKVDEGKAKLEESIGHSFGNSMPVICVGASLEGYLNEIHNTEDDSEKDIWMEFVNEEIPYALSLMPKTK